MLKEGDKAPAFTANDQDGNTVKLSALKGQRVVLYFYPKDDTSGCTVESLEFSALAKEFEAAGAIVVGMSPDPVKSHDRFRAKHQLAQPLASDESKTTLAAYGVWVEKSMYGRKYMGVERSTFLIDREGVIREVWRKVKVPGHIKAVMNAAKAIK